eukprot:SAG11_NODE_3524_length_2394_cov_74.641830_2_plen_441_part_00
MAYNLRTGLIGSGDIDINVNLNNLDAGDITSGTFDPARIPALSTLAGQVTDAQVPDLQNLSGQTTAAQVPHLQDLNGAVTDAQVPDIQNLSGQATVSQIPDMSADKITSGVLATARIPDMSADKITSGVLATARIPALSADQIVSEVLDTGRIPALDVLGGQIGTSQMLDQAVTTVKIANDAVEVQKLADNAVQTNKIYNEAVTEAKIDDGAVTRDKIGTGAVTETKIGTAAVTNSKIAAGAVDFHKIANDSVNGDKLTTDIVIGTSLSITSNFPINPPGHYHTTTTRRIQILPTDALHSMHNNSEFDGIEFSGYDESGDGVYGYAKFTGRMAIIKPIPVGYELQYIYLNTFSDDSAGAQNFPTINRIVTAYKIDMLPSVAPVLLTPAGDGASSNISYTNSTITISSTPTFSYREYLLINVFLTGNLDTFSGGWLTIAKA